MSIIEREENGIDNKSTSTKKIDKKSCKEVKRIYRTLHRVEHLNGYKRNRKETETKNTFG